MSERNDTGYAGLPNVPPPPARGGEETRGSIAEAALRVIAEGGPQEAFQCNNIAREILAELTTLLARLAAARGEDAPPSDAQSARQPGDPCDCGAMWAERDRLRTALAAAERAGAERAQAIPADQWREDFGPCLWWKDYLGEAPVVGSPLDSDWAEVNDPDEPFTHFTRIPNPVFPPPGAEVGKDAPICTSCGLRKEKCDGC